MNLKITVTVENDSAAKSIGIGWMHPMESGESAKAAIEMVPRLLRSAYKGAAVREVWGWELNDEQIKEKLASMSEEEFTKYKQRERELSGL